MGIIGWYLSELGVNILLKNIYLEYIDDKFIWNWGESGNFWCKNFFDRKVIFFKGGNN